MQAGPWRLRYERSTPQAELAVAIRPDGSAFVERRRGAECRLSHDDLPHLQFEQPAKGPVKLTVGVGDARREFQAGCLWRLVLQQPDVCRRRLLPLLESLRPGWDLAGSAARLEGALVLAAQSGVLPDRGRWAEAVDQLGSGRFSRRRAAERNLQAAGPAVAGYLRGLDPTVLDRERRGRIARILQAVSAVGDDTPPRVAAQLVDDAAVWTALAESDDPQVRAVAKRQLKKLARP